MSRVNTSPPTRLRGLIAALVVLAAVAGDTVARSAPARASPGGADPAAVVTVGRATVGRAVPAGFLGLSMELPAVEEYAGPDPQALNPVLEQLIRNLAPGQRPVLRLGGDSTDWTWFPVDHVPHPPWVRFTLTPGWMRVTKALTEALDARLIVGVNLEANRPKVAAAEAGALIAGLGRRSIEALEVGNEPELYGAFSWYHNQAGVQFTGRPQGYDFSGFTQDFSRVAGSLPHISLAGPAVGAPDWAAQLGPFLAAEPRVGLATLHAYPLKKCSATTNVTAAQLLSESSSIGLADILAPYAGVAHAHGVPLRIDEINAISCGGERGVSDTFASALWSLDAMFAMASVGVDGVNFHTVPNAINELFAFKLVNGVWRGSVRPNYYGLMMFAQAAPAGARLLKLSGPTGGTLRTWATLAPDGHVRVVLINTNTARAQLVAVRIPSARGPAALERLTAPAITAESGMSLGGQSFGSQTNTGLLAGKPESDSVTSSAGRYLVRLPAASAAMLTLSR
jgi:Glycosyl hydrolase family 79 C-terminal beta domain